MSPWKAVIDKCNTWSNSPLCYARKGENAMPKYGHVEILRHHAIDWGRATLFYYKYNELVDRRRHDKTWIAIWTMRRRLKHTYAEGANGDLWAPLSFWRNFLPAKHAHLIDSPHTDARSHKENDYLSTIHNGPRYNTTVTTRTRSRRRLLLIIMYVTRGHQHRSSQPPQATAVVVVVDDYND